jgi:hypothetical protein
MNFFNPSLGCGAVSGAVDVLEVFAADESVLLLLSSWWEDGAEQEEKNKQIKNTHPTGRFPRPRPKRARCRDDTRAEKAVICFSSYSNA